MAQAKTFRVDYDKSRALALQKDLADLIAAYAQSRIYDATPTITVVAQAMDKVGEIYPLCRDDTEDDTS